MNELIKGFPHLKEHINILLGLVVICDATQDYCENGSVVKSKAKDKPVFNWQDPVCYSSCESCPIGRINNN